MELLQLKYFCELADSGTLTKTAEKLYISPSSLSHTIKRLETELGVELFEREGRTIRLNDYGREFYSHVKNALDTLDYGARSTVEKYRLRSTITVGLNTPTRWDALLSGFRAAYPNISLNISIVYDLAMMNSILDRLDCYLGDKFDLPHSDYDCIPLFPEEPPVILMHKSNPRSGCTSLDLRDLGDETFFSQRQVNFSYDRWETTLFHLAGLDNLKFIEGNLISRIKNVSAGNCISLSTPQGLKTNFISSPEIVAIPLSYPIVYRQQCLFRKKSISAVSAAETFTSYVVQFSKDSGAGTSASF